MAAPTGAPIIDTKGNPFLSSIDNTPFIKKHFQEPDSQIKAKNDELQKLIPQFGFDPSVSTKVFGLFNDITNLRKERGSDYNYQMELSTASKLGGILSGDKNVVPTGYKVNPFIVENVIAKRDKFFQGVMQEPGGWEFGSPANIPSTIMFNPKEQGKAFGEVLTNFLTPVSQDDVKVKKMGISNYIQTTNTNKLVLDMPSVVNEMTNYVTSSPIMASYLSDLLGVNLFDENNNVKSDLVKNTLKGYIEPMYNASLSKAAGKEEKIQMGASDNVVKESIVRGIYNTNRNSTATIQQTFDATYKGGRVDKKTIENLSNTQVTWVEEVAEALRKNRIDPDKGVGLKVMEEAILKISAGEDFDKNDALDLAEALSKGKSSIKKGEEKLGLNRTNEELFNDADSRGKNITPKKEPTKKTSAKEKSWLERAQEQNKK